MRIIRGMRSMSEHPLITLLPIISTESYFVKLYKYYRHSYNLNDKSSIEVTTITRNRFKNACCIDSRDSLFSYYFEKVAYVMETHDDGILNLDSISDSIAGNNLENYSGLEND